MRVFTVYDWLMWSDMEYELSYITELRCNKVYEVYSVNQ